MSGEERWNSYPEAYKNYVLGAYPGAQGYEDLPGLFGIENDWTMLGEGTMPVKINGNNPSKWVSPKFNPMGYNEWKSLTGGGTWGQTPNPTPTPTPTPSPGSTQNPFPALVPSQLQDPFAMGGTGTTPGGTGQMLPFGFPYPYAPQTQYQPYQFSTGQAYGLNPLQLFGGDILRTQNLFNTIPASPVLAKK